MSSYLHLFLLAFLSSIIALIGGIVFIYNKKLATSLEKNAIPFAAGVMITTAIIGLLPEALEMIGVNALYILLATFFAAYIFEQFSFGIHHHTSDADGHSHNEAETPVALIILGDTIHNFIDGIAIGASFMINPGLGLITSLSTFLHEIPHEIGDFGILLKAGWEKKKVLLVNILSASTTIVGAFSIYLIPENPTLVGVLMALSAGFFLYLGTIDFLPQSTVGFSNKFKALIPLGIGVLAMVLTIKAIPHTHELEDGHDKEHENSIFQNDEPSSDNEEHRVNKE